MARPKKVTQVEVPVVAYVEGDDIQADEASVEVKQAVQIDFNLLYKAVKEPNLAKMQETVLKAVPTHSDELVMAYMESLANATFAAHAGQTVQQIIQRLKAL